MQYVELESKPKRGLIVIIIILQLAITASLISTWSYNETQKASVISYFGTNESGMVKVYGDMSQCELIKIKGNSMYPSMTSSNTVIAENITIFGIQNIVNGDVIVFYRNGNLVCHRVVSSDGTSFTVKGDNNSIPDSSTVPFLEVKYVVIAVLR